MTGDQADKTLKNYTIVQDADTTAVINKATLTLTTDALANVTYGDSKESVEGKYHSTLAGFTNGDNDGNATKEANGASSSFDVTRANGTISDEDVTVTTSTDLYNPDGSMKNVYTYQNGVKGEKASYSVTANINPEALTNYTIVKSNAQGEATNTDSFVLNQKSIGIDVAGHETEYGTVKQIAAGTLAEGSSLAKGDNLNDLNLKSTSEAYVQVNGVTRTNDVKRNGNEIAGYAINTSAFGEKADNYDISYTNGEVKVTPANLAVTTSNVSTTYGTVNTNYQTSHSALVNGDTDNLTYTYDDHGAYRDNYTYTNNVGNYALDTTANGDLLKNYNVTTNTANIEIGIKDITLNLTGTGSTTTNATITEGTPSYAAQLVNGDTTANAPQVSYSVGNLLSGNNYSIIVDVNGNPIAAGDVVDNYRFNYAGVATITPEDTTTPLVDRVKLDYRDTANLAGTGLYALDGGTNVVPGVSKVLGLTDAQLPFFKVAGGQVSNYGTYEVTETPTEVKVTPTAKHIPEPNKEKNQYRALNKTYELSNGTGAFNLVYDGTTFNIYPTDAKAKSLLKAGDPQHNVEVEAKALFSSFNEMGIVLEDLDAVYVHTDATEDETKDKEKA